MVTESTSESSRSESPKFMLYNADTKLCSTSTSPTSSILYPNRDTKEVVELHCAATLTTFTCSSVLLPEILTHIFQFLSLEDRKNVRLTCKLWYDCCIRPSIIAEEKFVFRADCSIPDIVEILLNFSAKRMNLEFQDIEMDCIPPTIWKTCGYKMRDLHFYRCYLNEETLRNIFMHCGNLTSINIYKDQDFDSNLKSLMVLDYFVERRIKYTQLHTFGVIARHSISVDLLRKIFEVFPCIKHFRARVKPPYDGEEFICVKSSTQLRSLTFSRGSHLNDFFWLEKPMIPVWQLRLTKFETHLYGVSWTASRRKTLFRFFSVQNDLKIISLEMKEADFAKDLTFHILESCLHLREFRFDCGSEILLTCQEITKFLTLISNLRCLTVTCTFRTETMPPLSTLDLALETLSLRHVCRHEEFSSYLLRHCSKVKHLQLSWPSDNILQDIFKNMPNLQTLILDDAYNCTKYGFIGHNRDMEQNFSISQLQNLEHLEICGATELTKDITRECRFPRLKLLKCVNINLRELVLNMPGLETLELYWYELTNINETIELCVSLKNLSRLRVGNIQVISLRPLFEACPNLRHVWNQCQSFSFNPFTKHLSRSFETNFKFPRKQGVFEE